MQLVDAPAFDICWPAKSRPQRRNPVEAAFGSPRCWCPSRWSATPAAEPAATTSPTPSTPAIGGLAGSPPPWPRPSPTAICTRPAAATVSSLTSPPPCLTCRVADRRCSPTSRCPCWCWCSSGGSGGLGGRVQPQLDSLRGRRSQPTSAGPSATGEGGPGFPMPEPAPVTIAIRIPNHLAMDAVQACMNSAAGISLRSWSCGCHLR
jgi:hypothetical protein